MGDSTNIQQHIDELFLLVEEWRQKAIQLQRQIDDLSRTHQELTTTIGEQKAEIARLNAQLEVAALHLSHSPEAHNRLTLFGQEMRSVAQEIESCAALLKKRT